MKGVLIADTLRWLTARFVDGEGKVSYPQCDINGKPLGPSSMPLPVYDDLGGKAWARLVAVMPSNSDPASVAMKEAYFAMKPVFVDGDGTMRGWYVPAPDFSKPPVADAA